MKKFDPDDTLAYLQPRRGMRPFHGSVRLVYDHNSRSNVATLNRTVCEELVPTREFLQRLREIDRLADEKVDITWALGNVWFHLVFDRNHLINTPESNGAAIKTEYAKLYAFHGIRRYEVLLDSSKAEFIVFRQHLQNMPPALHNAATELVDF